MTRFWRHSTGVVLCIAVAIGLYLTSGRVPALLEEQHRRADPFYSYTPQQQLDRQLVKLQQKIRQQPQDSTLWAVLGEYYLYQNQFDNALTAYQTALKLSGDNAQLYSALATVSYYQAGQQLNEQAKYYIERALVLDNDEVTALMLLASDAFLQADYANAMSIWQKLLDLNNPRLNRKEVIEALNMAKLLNQ